MTSDGPRPPKWRFARDAEGYVYSDGKPLGESSGQVGCIFELNQTVRELLADRLDRVSVYTNMFFYWAEGEPDERRDPDLMVIFGVPMNNGQENYKSWKHGGIVPGVIIETMGPNRHHQLFRDIRDDYEIAGVTEYFVYDCGGDLWPQPLTGYRLTDGRYRRIEPEADGTLFSHMLDHKLRPEGWTLRFVNPRTGEPVRPLGVSNWSAMSEARAKAEGRKIVRQSHTTEADLMGDRE